MEEKVIAIKEKDTIISVGCGKYCFSVENNELTFDENVTEFYEKQSKDKLVNYLAIFDLCNFAFENNIFDEEINN
jgi:hypothetical protein